MSKYRINDNPLGIPALELEEGETGHIETVHVHKTFSVIFTLTHPHREGYIIKGDDELNHMWGTLASYTDEKLAVLSRKQRYPIGELTELRDLERQFRGTLIGESKG